jgi:uncharacterized protein (TIGR03083 family)
MDVAVYHEALQRDAPALLTAASAADRGARIESCPEWTPADLVWHVGNVHAFFAAAIRDRFDDPVSYVRPERPARDEAVFDFASAAAAELLAVLPTADQAMLIQARSGPRTVGWVSRRMAHETAVHRFDAERAAGHDHRVEAELASDGVDEYLDFVLPRTVAQGLRLDGSVHLHCTDVAGEWIIEPGDDGGFEVRREHTKGAAAVRGPAHELLMVLWRRLPLEAVDVIGDQTVVAQLVSVPI